MTATPVPNRILYVMPSVGDRGTPSGHTALEADDSDAKETRLLALGVKVPCRAGPVIFAPEDTDVKEVIAFIEDPHGDWIELIEKMAH
ncbi:hypothetical protein [uncultured Tateyamaria sp.]|uniref:hypothetical protein n=1 Tax=uncultured Tateyamaria sp. TaxID=455651 RepID=UPI00262188A3|nr:hypothetical protein [uncultured Tateyamaria sp.]